MGVSGPYVDHLLVDEVLNDFLEIQCPCNKLYIDCFFKLQTLPRKQFVLNVDLKCICHHKKKKKYVKGTHFRSPLHQHPKKKVHEVMKIIMLHKVKKITGSEKTLEKTTPLLHCLQGLWALFWALI